MSSIGGHGAIEPMRFEEIGNGVFCSDTTEAIAGRPALILDRDGVVVEEVNYLSRPDDVRLMPGICDLIAAARGQGAAVAVVTNQAGIARGLFGWNDYHAVARRINELLAARGCALDVTVVCPFHPDFTVGYDETHAYWRKPGPGMLRHLADRFGIDLARSWMIGDNASDIAAAKAAPTAGAIHMLTGHGKRFQAEAASLGTRDFPVKTCIDLDAARETMMARFKFA